MIVSIFWLLMDTHDCQSKLKQQELEFEEKTRMLLEKIEG